MNSLAVHFPVSESEKEAILSQYGKTKETIKEDVEILKEWLKKQKHIPATPDLFLEIQLLRNKCRIEKTKIKIDNYYTTKTVEADYFTTLDPCSDAIVNVNKYHHTCPMPKLGRDHERIIFWTMMKSSMKNFNQPAFMQYYAIMLETQLQLDYVDNSAFIFDLTGLTLAMWLTYDLNILAKLIKNYFESFTDRIDSVHFTNPTAIVDLIIKFIKSVLPMKLKDRIFVHSKLETIYDHFPKECLPSEIGGTSVSCIELSNEISKMHQDNRELILNRNTNSSNEKLRIGKPYIEVDLFGIDGTFKKIHLD